MFHPLLLSNSRNKPEPTPVSTKYPIQPSLESADTAAGGSGHPGARRGRAEPPTRRGGFTAPRLNPTQTFYVWYVHHCTKQVPPISQAAAGEGEVLLPGSARTDSLHPGKGFGSGRAQQSRLLCPQGVSGAVAAVWPLGTSPLLLSPSIPAASPLLPGTAVGLSLALPPGITGGDGSAPQRESKHSLYRNGPDPHPVQTHLCPVATSHPR